MPLKWIRSDITVMQTDAVVNPANSRLRRSSGVCDTVFARAGTAELNEACRRIGCCASGNAVITPGFKLPARFIIHAVVPLWLGGRFSARNKLRSCYIRSLNLALKHDLHSIAFPLLRAEFPACSKLSCSIEEAIDIAQSAIGSWLMENDSDMDVYLVLSEKDTFTPGRLHHSRLQTFIDNQYIGDQLSDILRLLPPGSAEQSSAQENIPPIKAALTSSCDIRSEEPSSDLLYSTETASDDIFSEDTFDFDIRLEDTSAHPPYDRQAAREDLSQEDTLDIWLDETLVSDSQSDTQLEDTSAHRIHESRENLSWEDTLDLDLSMYESDSPSWEDNSCTPSRFSDCDGSDFYASDDFNSPFGPDYYEVDDNEADVEDSESPCEIIPIPLKAHKREPRRLEDILKQVDESFSEMLFRLIDQCGMSDPEVYKRANMDRRLFSKIRSNPNYQPAKSTVFALAIALRLNLDQTTDLLCRAGFAFSPSSKSDIIIKYFIREGIFNIHEINEALFSYKQKLLGA